ALSSITRLLPQGTLVLSGTNGKTTSARLASHMLSHAGRRPLHNRAGANLLSGLVTAVAADADLRGRPHADVGVFEVDEATLPAALRQVTARALLLTNLFRDQLDRYGEVDYVAGIWKQALGRLDGDCRLVLNADDPLVAGLACEQPERAVFYGIEDGRYASVAVPHAADARLCTRCGARLEYAAVFYGHLGHYRCGRCG